MQKSAFRSLFATSLLSLAASCASFQTGDLPGGDPIEPLDTPVLTEEDLDTLILAEDQRDDGDPPIRLDYIDDRLSRPIRQFSIFAGARDFTDDDIWGRVDAEFALGIEYAHEIENGLGYEIGGLGSLGTDDGVSANVDVTGAAAELYGGARYWFKNEDSRWTPYVGGGLSMILAGIDNDEGGQVADDQDFTLGVYAHGGVQYDLNDSLYLGADLRTLLGTDLNLETISGDADYWQLGLVLGFRL